MHSRSSPCVLASDAKATAVLSGVLAPERIPLLSIIDMVAGVCMVPRHAVSRARCLFLPSASRCIRPVPRLGPTLSSTTRTASPSNVSSFRKSPTCAWSASSNLPFPNSRENASPTIPTWHPILAIRPEKSRDSASPQPGPSGSTSGSRSPPSPFREGRQEVRRP